MKSALIHIRGLFDSDPLGTWCGARKWAEPLAEKYRLDLLSDNWDGPDVMHIVDHVRDQGYQFVALTGHSHGGDRVKTIANRYGPEALDLVGLIDDCPPESLEEPLAPLAHLLPPKDFPAAAKFGYAVWQNNSAPTGCRFNARAGVLVEDATPWQFPRIGHIDYPTLKLASIAGDWRVWTSIEQQLKAAIDARTYPTSAPVGAAPSPSAPSPHGADALGVA